MDPPNRDHAVTGWVRIDTGRLCSTRSKRRLVLRLLACRARVTGAPRASSTGASIPRSRCWMTWAENEVVSAVAIPDWVATAMTPTPMRKQASRLGAHRRPRTDRRLTAERYHQRARTMAEAAAGSNRLLVSASPIENEAASTTGPDVSVDAVIAMG